MKASETNFLQFLKNPKHLMIPVYQRVYSWREEQCAQLWKDIERLADDSESAHFLGSVVYIEKGLYHVSSVPKVLIIDGQQRLTTLSLLLAAFAKVIDEKEKICTQTNARKVRNYYLFNAEEEDDTYYKLSLTSKDKDTYRNIIEQKELDQNYSGRLIANYEYFYKKIKQSPLSLDAIFNGLQKLIIVDISLDREKDNPQLIFESLNSTGLDLTQTDLIRNYFLMGLDQADQNRLYNDFWYKLEKKFEPLGNANSFDRFIRDYLTIKTGKIPNIGKVYEEFKVYVTESPTLTIEDIIKDVYHFGNYFIKIAHEDPNPKLDEVFGELRELKVEVAYPFLLHIYKDYAQGVIDEEKFIRIIKTVESYVFRRAICGIPTNSLNKTFASLHKSIDTKRYYESISEAFTSMTSYRRFPSDSEFREELFVKDIYHLRVRNYLLRKLENYKRKEKISVANYTIEHVLPQNPNLLPEWQIDLGVEWKSIQEQYLHRLGNLTLTGYNSELSDRPFSEKKRIEGGFSTSPLWLNKSIAQYEKWTHVEIEARANELIKRALLIWSAVP